jgi:hypothetical protein
MPPECKRMWTETAVSFMFGQYFAALCVAGALVECLLGKAIPVFEEQAGRPSSPLPTNLKGLIDRAVAAGLVETGHGDLLQDFRRFVRNKFAHGDIPSLADSLFAIRNVTFFTVKPEGEITRREWSPTELAELQNDTLGERLAVVQEEYAMKVIPWIGRWAALTADKIWKPAQDTDSSA